jgi:hypothetical protein
MEQDQNAPLFSLNLDAQNSYTLRSAASWSKVLGVVGMILGILFIILGILVQQVVTRNAGYTYRSSGISSSTIGNMGLIFYIIMGLVMIVSSMFSLTAGNKINAALKANDQDALSKGFAAARNYFALWAIIIIICLLFVLLGVLTNL